jgi:hypothetical protein
MTGQALEARIADWRRYVTKSGAIDAADADELEEHLRDRIDELEAAGLDDDEAFLVAVKRLGAVDALSREYARSSSARLWKQLLPGAPDERPRRDIVELIGFAIAAAVAIQLTRLASLWASGEAVLEVGAAPIAGETFAVNAGLVVLAALAAYLLRRRRASWRLVLAVAAPFVVAVVLVNLYPFGPDWSTQTLTAVHLPVALWLVVGVAYVSGDWRSPERRMNFVRFTGEFLVYYTLIALGGAVLLALTTFILMPVFPDAIGTVLPAWVLPSGAAGAVIVAAWLVEAKQAVIENIAPVLTAIFTPLFALLVVSALVSYLTLGLSQNFDRDLLMGFDALLIVVLGLVLYSLSARDARKPPGIQDVVTLVTVAGALLLDLLVLWSLLTRVGDLGWTPNRVAALGLNVVLVVVLTGAAWLGARFLARRTPMTRLERWQTGYLPVYGLWAAFVALALPPIFGFS